MCRYSYRSGACANRHIESLDCVGEDNCQYSEMNVLTRKHDPKDGDCGLHKWLGLYCEKYGRFYCSGDANCSTPESYMRHFEEYKDRAIKRPGEE